MGVGEFLSSKANNEWILSEKKREEWELENYRDGEIQEMVDIYVSKGMNLDDAKICIETMAKYDDFFVDVMMQQELELQVPEENHVQESMKEGALFLLYSVLGMRRPRFWPLLTVTMGYGLFAFFLPQELSCFSRLLPLGPCLCWATSSSHYHYQTWTNNIFSEQPVLSLVSCSSSLVPSRPILVGPTGFSVEWRPSCWEGPVLQWPSPLGTMSMDCWEMTWKVWSKYFCTLLPNTSDYTLILYLTKIIDIASLQTALSLFIPWQTRRLTNKKNRVFCVFWQIT